ncbi:MAG: protoporphyrinogen oxidase HemJ [Pseudomonadota bacterium]
MAEFLLENYLWLRALHVVAVISWMAGLFYLPRLYVYHVGAGKGSNLSETFKIMERKLLHIIMTPAMVLTWISGTAMIVANPGMFTAGKWLHIKLAAVLLMQIFHVCLSGWRKDFLRDENRHTGSFYRKANEIPTLLMFVIVAMAIIKPF